MLLEVPCGRKIPNPNLETPNAQAFSWISPVYVTAVKRGGGILLASLIGVLFFGESMAGRMQPILTIVIGVTFLCL